MAIKHSKRLGITSKLTVDERIKAREDFDLAGVKSFFQTTVEDRSRLTYKIFSMKEEVWTAWDSEGLYEFYCEDEKVAVPVWPFESIARFGLTRAFDVSAINFVPIPLDDFIDEVVFASLQPYRIAISPLAGGEAAIVHGPLDFSVNLKNFQ